MNNAKTKHVFSENQVDTEGSWAISYADLVTLLLTFFVMFFSFGPDKARVTNMQTELIEKLIEPVNASQGDQALKFTLLKEKMDTELLADAKARVHKIGKNIIIEFPETSFFDSGKVDVLPNAENLLFAFVDKYTPYAGSYMLGIRAFTDEQKVKPGVERFKDNLELSALRSIAAMRIMQKAGIPLSRMKIGGYGELRDTFKELYESYQSMEHDVQLALSRKVILVIEPERRNILE